MGWLLELLLDGIREICSQFIVDMMELVTEMFTELLSCNLSLFEELFSVVGSLYKNVVVPMGIAMLLLILVWQLFKSMFGKSVNGEEPVELLIRSAIALFFVVGSRPIVNYVLKFAGTPYQWVVGTEIQVESFSGFVTALEGVTETLGIGKLSISLLMLIMQFVVAWNYFKMLFVIAERYVLLGVFSYTAPLAFSTGGSKSTNNVLASWAKMFGGQMVLIILNAWCMKMFLSGYGNMMASGYGFTKFFVATLCLVGFCKITFKLDSYMASLGVNLGRPSAGMGAMGLIMAASRIISQIGRGSAGGGESTPPSSTETSGGSSAGNGMAEGFAGPIPMMPSGTSGPSADTPDMSTERGVDEAPDVSRENKTGGDFTYSPDASSGGSVMEELGVVETGSSDGADMASGTGMGAGTSVTVAGLNGAVGGSYGNRSGVEANRDSHTGMDGEKGSQNTGFASGRGDGAEMDLNAAGIPGYVDPGAGNVADAKGTEGIVKTTGQPEHSGETGYGNGTDGIISEVGDYPVEETDFDSPEDSVMELEGSSIDSMGSPSGTEEGAYGTAGDAFGSVGIAGGVKPSGSGTGLGAQRTTGAGMGMDPMGSQAGILDEVGTELPSGGIEPYGKTAGSGEPGYSEAGVFGDGGALSDMELGENSGILSHMDSGAEGGSHPSVEPGESNGSISHMESGTEGRPHSNMEPGENSGIFSHMDSVAGSGSYSAMKPGMGGSISPQMNHSDDNEMYSGMELGKDGSVLQGPGAGDNRMESSTGAGEDAAFQSGSMAGEITDAYTGIGSEGIKGTAVMPESPITQDQNAISRETEGNSDHFETPGSMENDSGMESGDLGKADQTSRSLENAGRNRGAGLNYSEENRASMEGQMSQMGAGQTIPSGEQNSRSHRREMREFMEVPKTREEMRSRRQGRSEQKTTDGSPFD